MPRYDIRLSYLRDQDDEEPTLGVREPRRPSPSPRTSGTTAPLQYEPEPEAEAIAASASMTPDQRSQR